MNTKNDESCEKSDNDLLDTIRMSADVSSAFAAISDWGRERFIRSIHSRGDSFDRSAILILNDNDNEILLPISSLPVTIGSSTKADVRLKYDGVSRLQCHLESIGNLVRVVDHSSTNGTILNNKKISQEDLCDGDELKLGTITLRIRKM